MSLVVGINTEKCSIITADSRVTTECRKHLTTWTTHVDCCQKVFRIGEATIIGFCGNLVVIADILNTLALLYQHNPDLISIEQLSERLPIGLKLGSIDFLRRFGKYPDIGLIVAGRNIHGRFDMFICESPDFHAQPIHANDIVIMGSGTPIIQRIDKDLKQDISIIFSTGGLLSTPQVATHHLAFVIGGYVERRLKDSGISSVSRVFHTLYVDADNVYPAPYEIAELGAPGSQKRLIVGTRINDQGRWIQYSIDGDEIELMNPIDLILDKNIFINDRILQAFK